MKTRSEKNLEVCISTSLLDANRSLLTSSLVWKLFENHVPVLGLAGCHWRKTGKLLVRFHRNIAASSLAADWQCSPAAPCLSRGFTSIIQMFHTHTHTLQREGGKIKVRTMKWNEVKLKGNEDEVKMKMRWKLLNQDAKRGTQKKREGANTNTGKPGPKRANPERAREKKSGGRRTQNKTRGGGGKDGSA